MLKYYDSNKGEQILNQQTAKELEKKYYIIAKADEVAPTLCGKFRLHRGQLSAANTRANKKFEQDAEANLLKQQIADLQTETQVKLDYYAMQYKDGLKELNNTLRYMLMQERTIMRIKGDSENTAIKYMLPGGYLIATQNIDGEITLAEPIKSEQPTKKQLALFEKYGALRSVEAQTEKQQKKLSKQLGKLYKKDPEFINLYIALKLQEKVIQYQSEKYKLLTEEYSFRVDSVKLKKVTKEKELARKLDTIKRKYTNYVERIIQQKDNNFIVENAETIAKFAKTFGIQNAPQGAYMVEFGQTKVNLESFALAVLSIKGKQEKIAQGKCYFPKAVVRAYARELREDVISANVTFEQTTEQVAEDNK